MLTGEISKVLNSISESDIIITLGNAFRKDDGAGCFIFNRIKELDNIRVINAGTNPESIVDVVVGLKPERIIYIDAADFGGAPGDIRLIDKNSVSKLSISTHTFPLAAISEIIESESKAESIFIGIQVKQTGFGEGLTDEVKKAAELLIGFFYTKIVGI